MSETLYMDIKQSCKVKCPDVYVRDVADITCTDSTIINRINALKIWTFHNPKDNRYIFSSIKLMELILKECPSLKINPIGETEFLIEYEPKAKNTKLLEYLKVSLISIILFFGSGFTIMAFNNDIDIKNLFDTLYEKSGNIVPDGISALEIGYSIGIFLGIMLFYNHMGKKKITSDPTPIEVEMRKYEQDINTTLINGIHRKESRIDVDK